MFFQFWIRSVQRFSLPHSLAYLLSLILACSLAHLLALSCSLALSLTRFLAPTSIMLRACMKAARLCGVSIWISFECFYIFVLLNIFWMILYLFCISITFLFFCFFKLVSSLRCIFHMHKEHDSSSVHPASTAREASAAVDDPIPWLGEGPVDGLVGPFNLFL